MYNFKSVQILYQNYDMSNVDKTVSPSETMANEVYFEIGRSAVEVIVAALLATQVQSVKKVLDMPCGHGRVLRHLVQLFPDAEISACDVDREGVEFCAAQFGARPIFSKEDLASVDFEEKYDIIWVGSLFTHTSKELTEKWMAHLCKFLSPTGIIIATSHGRWSEYVHDNYSPYMGGKGWRNIMDQYRSSGYGYSDYAESESHDYIAGSYGVSLVRPNVLIKIVESLPDVRIFFYGERFWADHQDVIVFGRPSVNDPWTKSLGPPPEFA